MAARLIRGKDIAGHREIQRLFLGNPRKLTCHILKMFREEINITLGGRTVRIWPYTHVERKRKQLIRYP